MSVSRGRRWWHNTETGELYQPVSVAHVVEDATNGRMQARQVNLVADTVASITFPNWCTGFRIYAADNMVRYAISEDPVSLTATDWTIGDIALPNQWDGPRIIAEADGQQLRLLASLNTTVYVAIF